MNIMLKRNETVILDMEAGFEHLTRGTAQAFDAMIIVIEPSIRTVITARRIRTLAEKTGIKKIFYVANKIKNEEDDRFIEKETENGSLLGKISMSDGIMTADREGKSPFDTDAALVEEIKKIALSLFKTLGS